MHPAGPVSLVEAGIRCIYSCLPLHYWVWKKKGERKAKGLVSPRELAPGGRLLREGEHFGAPSTLMRNFVVVCVFWTDKNSVPAEFAYRISPPPPPTSVGTTDQGKGKGRSVVRPMGTVAYRGKGQGKGKGRGEGRLGQGGRGRSKGGEKLMGTTAYGGKGSKGRAANGDRPVGAASCRRDHHTMASCQNPHLPRFNQAWHRE